MDTLNNNFLAEINETNQGSEIGAASTFNAFRPSHRKKWLSIVAAVVGVVALISVALISNQLLQRSTDSRSQAAAGDMVVAAFGTLVSPRATISVSTESRLRSGNVVRQVIDNNPNTFWTADPKPNQWIQLDLQKPITLSAVRLLTKQTRTGVTRHRVFASSDPNLLTEVAVFEGTTSDNQWLEKQLATPVPNVRYVRVMTEQAVSVTAWREVQAYEFNPAVSPSPSPIPSTSASPSPSVAPTPTPNPSTSYGWDNGIKKRCLKTAPTPTVTQGTGAPFQDLQGCESGSPNNWTLGIQSESGYQASGTCQGLPAVNATDSPLGFKWLDRGNGTYAAEMSIDLLNKRHPCEGNYFNWFVLMDQNASVVYPLPNKLVSEHVVFYTTESRNGAARLIAGMSGFVRTTPTAPVEGFTVEVGLRTDSNWGDNFPNSPLISKCTVAECGSNHVFLDGSFFGLQVPTNQETRISIPWHQIYDYLLREGHIPRPHEASGAYLSTGGVSLGFEVNNFNSVDSYKANLIQADFNIKSL